MDNYLAVAHNPEEKDNMSARIVGMNGELDPVEGQDNGDDPLAAALAQQGSTPQPKPSVQDTLPSTDEIEEKYRGKSAQELLDMVRHQEGLIGRQTTELGDLRNQVGTLRGTVDRALALRDPDNSREPVGHEAEELTDVDFAKDPVDATRRMIQRETQGLAQSQAQLDAQARAIQFEREHPNAAADMNDEKFIEFVKQSPSRQRLATRAFADMSSPDFEAADQLWDLYDDYKKMTPQQKADAEQELAGNDGVAPQTPPAQAKQPPAMVTGNSQGGVTASSNAGKEVFSQAALNRLQSTHPDEYWSDSTQARINAARAEGRIVQDV